MRGSGVTNTTTLRTKGSECIFAAMLIRSAHENDIEDWVALRTALWPDQTRDLHRAEVTTLLTPGDERQVALVAADDVGRVIAFAEASLRQDYVNGCDTSPVVFVEGIYVHPGRRRSGIAKALCHAIEAWGREQGCNEMASDALLENLSSHAFHEAVGFDETERVVYFRKLL
jgi:aminoglycoside 6'-N-acetyltransferase I